MLIPKLSRTKSGELSFGWMGRTMLSVGVFILGVIAYFLAAGNLGFEPGWTSFEMYLPVFFIVGGGMLWAVWRPSRVDSRHR
jgi:peptidoglycan/LPS O-acetylase OafA/YrhL